MSHIDDHERYFWDSVDRNGPVPVHAPQLGACWVRNAWRDPFGYTFASIGQQKRMLAHRYAWLLLRGDPGRLCVLHACDNPACVRVDHLFLGTRQDNMRDKISKGRHYRGERHHRAKLSTSQVIEARELVEDGFTQSLVARHLGVDPALVSRIVRHLDRKDG